MEKNEIIKKEVNDLLKKMINQFEVLVQEDNEIFQITIKTEEAPVVIGRHGETIHALQKIIEVILYKKFNQSIKIFLNVNDYQEKQKERLETIAKEKAEKVIETGQPSFFTRLSSYERRIVHQFISDYYPQLTSYSVDSGSERKIIIQLKEKESINSKKQE